MTTCGRNIRPAPNRSPDEVHPVHERTLDYFERTRRRLARLLGVLHDELVDPLHERVREALAHRCIAPSVILRLPALPSLMSLSHARQPFGAIRATGEEHVLHGLTQLGWNLVVDGSAPAFTIAMSIPALIA